MSRSTVVLPDPEGPSIEKNSPGAMSRSTPSTAVTAPNCLRSPTRRIAASADPPGSGTLAVWQRRQSAPRASADRSGWSHLGADADQPDPSGVVEPADEAHGGLGEDLGDTRGLGQREAPLPGLERRVPHLDADPSRRPALGGQVLGHASREPAYLLGDLRPVLQVPLEGRLPAVRLGDPG